MSSALGIAPDKIQQEKIVVLDDHANSGAKLSALEHNFKGTVDFADLATAPDLPLAPGIIVGSREDETFRALRAMAIDVSVAIEDGPLELKALGLDTREDFTRALKSDEMGHWQDISRIVDAIQEEGYQKIELGGTVVCELKGKGAYPRAKYQFRMPGRTNWDSLIVEMENGQPAIALSEAWENRWQDLKIENGRVKILGVEFDVKTVAEENKIILTQIHAGQVSDVKVGVVLPESDEDKQTFYKTLAQWAEIRSREDIHSDVTRLLAERGVEIGIGDNSLRVYPLGKAQGQDNQKGALSFTVKEGLIDISIMLNQDFRGGSIGPLMYAWWATHSQFRDLLERYEIEFEDSWRAPGVQAIENSGMFDVKQAFPGGPFRARIKESLLKKDPSIARGEGVMTGAARSGNIQGSGVGAHRLDVISSWARDSGGRRPPEVAEMMRIMTRDGMAYEEAREWHRLFISKTIIQFPVGFWKNQITAKNMVFAALDDLKVDQMSFREARDKKNIAEMARIYRERVLYYPGGQLQYFQDHGLVGMMTNEREYLAKRNHPESVLAFVFPEILDIAQGGLTQDEVGKVLPLASNQKPEEVQTRRRLVGPNVDVLGDVQINKSEQATGATVTKPAELAMKSGDKTAQNAIEKIFVDLKRWFSIKLKGAADAQDLLISLQHSDDASALAVAQPFDNGDSPAGKIVLLDWLVKEYSAGRISDIEMKYIIAHELSHVM
ncbi:MAG: hypothetical protein HQL21_07305, partial [Candidatus Omnitrophica bacterium]|nr:hypothetical protein [Candidatus Omnitrophota bacterium]